MCDQPIVPLQLSKYRLVLSRILRQTDLTDRLHTNNRSSQCVLVGQIISHLSISNQHVLALWSDRLMYLPPSFIGESTVLFVLTGPPNFCSVPSFKSLASSTCLFSHGRQLIPSHGVHNNPLLLHLAAWGGRGSLTTWKTAWENASKGLSR
ncbi:hypothetical protein F4809DRAFT_589660 [Biscogniauxia mediterranea]|nr:hypothetical protein F4809DRAFT_589660 [Biscogniauxia mediterranea]